MKKFIDTEWFENIDIFKQAEDNNVFFSKTNNNGSLSTGFIYEGFTRSIEVQTGTETVTVKEAVEEVLDEEGNVIVAAEPAVTEEQPVFETQTINVWDRLHELHDDPNSPVTILPVDIEPIKESAKQTINSQRDALIKGGIDYLGNNYQTDDESIMNMMGAIITGSSVTWLTSDNQEVTLTATEIAGLGQAVAARKQTLVYLARSYKDHIDTLTDKTSIDSYLAGLTWE